MTKFVVTLLIEADEVGNDDVKEYISEAVEHWGGQMPPDHPFFGDNKTISGLSVKRYRKPRKKAPKL